MVQDNSDPLAMFTKPPANETPAERTAREAQEAEARRRSEAIDEELRKEKARLKREEKNLVRVLLLGQSESGASASCVDPFVALNVLFCREVHDP